MKKGLLFLSLLFLVVFVNAQTVIMNRTVKVLWGSSRDTITDGGIEKSEIITTSAGYIRGAVLGGRITAKSGTSYSIKLYLEKSFDRNVWLKVDSVTLSNSVLYKFDNTYKDVRAPYIRVRTAKVSGTYVLKPQAFVLLDIEK